MYYNQRSTHCLTPYRSGFEDAFYNNIYHNPYRRRHNWDEYNQGHADGTNAKRAKRTLNLARRETACTPAS